MRLLNISCILCQTLLLLLTAEPTIAQSYPAKPLTIKVAFPAGGPADVAVRAANVVLERYLGKPIITENVPGANGSIAVTAVLKASSDGYTLLGTTGSDFITAPATIPSAKYEPEKFKLIGIVGDSDFVLLSSRAHAFKTVDELIDYALKPGNKELTLAHWGAGSSPQVVGADFQSRTGTKFLEVPYKGVAPVIADMLGGHIDLAFVPIGGGTLSLIQTGEVNAIAIASAERNPMLPTVPTLGESAKVGRFEYSIWAALFAPPDTPDEVVARLNDAMNVWSASDENLERIKANASRSVAPMDVSRAMTFFKSERQKYLTVLGSLSVKPQ
ncbi:tripartite tricarboxylate transporter substrate binding protein [Bradyrhizobium sp.]|jgi:tripartite-type tricarboxylate transporter receptor subunit TctC|uniref:tripartite tricarboxylate transporter substrate binding protein n=1 Tax=Bradyrhizobium sp. TaxID=376 RepID=UPI002DDCA36A|nr:tripartite tricarboxylate transporter substrate binding protein [Bradyrhizobium sp.]HEV2160478.1 tripartite tricarboxylate transporter substrate binding protein [Bradyrhizobium sp.]